jgi:hypothetical protein
MLLRMEYELIVGMAECPFPDIMIENTPVRLELRLQLCDVYIKERVFLRLRYRPQGLSDCQ